MSDILPVLLTITALFFIFLAARAGFTKHKKAWFCAICVAVSATWISLLALYHLGIFQNQLIIALLLGETTLGIFYLARVRFGKEFRLFQLPLLLTLITAGYMLFSLPGDTVPVTLFLAALWALFALVYVFRKNRKLKLVAKELISCCRQL